MFLKQAKISRNRLRIIACIIFLIILSIDLNYSQCVCPPDTTFYTDPEVCTVITDTLMPVSGCSIGALSYELTGATIKTGDTIINDTFNLGITKVIYTDGTNYCSFKVLVKDMEPPGIIGCDDISTVANPGDCGAQVYFDEISIIDNSTLCSGSVTQYHDFNISSKEELTGYGWQFSGFDIYEDDTCLRSNVLISSEAYKVTTPFYDFNSGDTLFLAHWTSGHTTDNDSLIVYLINSADDTTKIFDYDCNDNNIRHYDTIEINYSGFYKILFTYLTDADGSVRGYFDDVYIQAEYAHHDENGSDIPTLPMQVFQLDSTFISGDIFPVGEIKIQYKVIDPYGNYTIEEFIVSVTGGENIISGETEVEENSIHLYTTTGGMSDYSWTIEGGIEYGGNDEDSIYVFWNTAGNGTISVEYNDGGTPVTSCELSVTIDEIEYGCFEYKRKLTIDHTLVEADLENFPVLIYDTISEFRHVSYGGHIAHYNGYDIAFSTDSNGINRIAHQLDCYDPVNGILAVWVLVPDLDGDVNTEFYMHYGNYDINHDISSDTLWSEDFVGVYHMGTDLKDYGQNNNTATNSGTEVINGRIGKARYFERDDNDHITIPNEPPFHFTTEMTITYWIYVESFPTAPGQTNDWMDIIIKGDNVNWRFVSNRNDSNLYYAFNTGGTGGPYYYDIASGYDSFQPGNWYYIAGTWNSYNDNNPATNVKRLYINTNVWNSPVYVNNSITDAAYNRQPVIFGLNSDAADTRSLHGVLDEIRISNKYQTDSWIRTDFNTQSNPENFISFGPEKTGTVVSSVGGEVNILEDTIFAREYINGELSNYSGSIQWQWSVDNSDFEDIDGATEENLLSEPLLESTYFRALVSNRGCATSSTVDSVIVTAGFIDCEYNYRREIIVDPDSVSGTDDFENFPLLVEIEGDYMRWVGSDPDNGNVESEYGYDIIFTSDDGISIIPHEIDTFDGVYGLYRAWVKVPTLRATESTSVFMYYGKTGITQDPSSSLTWNSDYIGVWHFNDNFRDTVGVNHGTETGTISFDKGIISNGASFDGSGEYLTTPASSESDFDIPTNGAISVSCWININSFSSADEDFISKGSATPSWELRRLSTTNYGAFYIDLVGDYYLASGNIGINSEWHYICGSFNDINDATVLYVDSSLASTRNDPGGNITTNNNNSSVRIGGFDGMIDELRIVNAYRSEDWIKTEFRNQNNPQGFYTIWEPRELCTADPDGGTISSDDTIVCVGRNAVIELHNSDGNIYWQESTDSITWQFIRGETDTILVTDILTDTMYYRAVVSESCCSDYSPVIRIDYNDTDPPDVKIYVKNIACAGSDDGIIDIVPQPHVFNYTYNWSNGETTEDIGYLEPGIYSVTIVDNDSKCNLKESREILESERILVTLINLDDVTCSGNDGAIDIAVTGGTLPDVFIFDSTHYIRIEDNDSLDNEITSEGCIELRFYTTDTARQGAIIYKGEANDADSSYSLILNHNTLIFNYTYNSSENYILTWDSVRINKWYHAAIDWDSDSIIFYINGIPKDTVLISNNLRTSDDSLYLGKKGINPSSTKDYYMGYIRDFKIWNRSRNQANIADSMKIPLIGTEPGLLGYWPMDENGNDSIFNNTPNENIHGAILPVNGINWTSTNYEYLWTNDSISQDISYQDTGNFTVTVTDAYGCFEERDFYIDFDDAIKVAPSPPELRMQGNRYGEGPVILKVFGPDDNCPDSATRYIWYLEDTQGGQSVQGFEDSLYIPYLTASQTYYVASVNLPGIESSSRTAVNAMVNDLDSLYRSLYLSNTNDYANLGKFDYYEPVSEISIITWIYMSELDDGATIIENGWDGSNGVKLYYDATEDSIIFAVNSVANNVKTTIEEDKWYNIAVTYDKQKIKIYKNGEIQDSLNYTADISYSTDSLFIGRVFRGYIDDVTLWDTALNSNQLKALMFQVLEVCNYDEDIYDGLNMSNLRFYSNFDYSNDAEDVVISNNFLNNGYLRNGASISDQVPFDNWFPVTDENWHTTSNWYSGSLPDSANPGFTVLNADTAELNGSDAKCYGLILKQNANFNTLNDGSNKLSIFGDIYNADIILNAYEVGKAESYSSIELKAQSGSDNYSLGNIASNAFQSSILSKGLRGFYFNDDSFKNILYTSIDTTIDFDYETNPPNSYIDNDGNYSVLWCGYVQAPITGDITFYLTTEGVSNMFVNDSLIISCDSTSSPFENTGLINLTNGQLYVLILSYSENSGSGSVRLEWEYSGQSRQFIPAAYLRPFTGIVE